MERLDKILGQLSTPELVVARRFLVAGREAAVVFNPDITDTETIRTVILALESVGVSDNASNSNNSTSSNSPSNPNNSTSSDSKSTPSSLLELSDLTVSLGGVNSEADSDTSDLSLDILMKRIVFAAEVSVKDGEVMDDLLSGDSIVVVDGVDGFLVVGTRKWDKRAVAEPPAETVLKGPREGFIEDIKTNLSLLERRLKTPDLAVERIKIGRVSKTSVALCYISNIASPKTVKLIRKKLESIDIDALIDASYIQPLIEPHPYSIFHQMGSTEKPDVAAAKLLEGRIAIVVDGSPTVLTAPFLLVEDFQTAEDYYQRSAFVFFLRALRYASIVLAILLPGFYVAVQVFHFEVIPVKFLVTLLNAVEGIPLAPLPEVLFVMLLFEIIREASVRMPRAVGMAMSIVGALVLGETAVSAGMISSPAVMIVALSSIALYTAPNDVGVVSLLRIMFVLIGGIGGLFALMMGVLIILTILVNFDSFGTPYLAPFAPLVPSDLKDSIYRDSILNQKTRPFSIPNINHTRKK